MPSYESKLDPVEVTGKSRDGVRRPAVAGSFYPAAATELEQTVCDLLQAAAPLPTDPRPPKALIVPHAAYRYSGPTAAAGYASIRMERPRCVVLIGPAHFTAFDGVAASSAVAFETPLGRVEVDVEERDRLLADGWIELEDRAHAREHSLEVQLPFLQTLFDRFVLLPFAVGTCGYERVSLLLDEVWNGPERLIVISSDLSHYENDQTARRLDAETAHAIEALEPQRLRSESACGRIAMAALLLSARRHGLRAKRLAMANSGDTGGSHERVVGYGTWAFYPRVCGMD